MSTKTNKSIIEHEAILMFTNGASLTIQAGVVIITDEIGMNFETGNVQYFVPYSAIIYLKQYDDPTDAAADLNLVYAALIS